MGDNIYLLIFYSVIGVLVLVAFFLILYIRNQNMIWQQRKLFQETEILQQKQLLNAVIESQESERKRIGADLHDEIGGALSAIKLMLNTSKQQDPINLDHISSAKQLIDQMIIDVRHIAHDLSPPGLAMFGLHTSLEAFISLINQSDEIEIQLIHEPLMEGQVLSEKTELALFRIITQLISNTLKHAEASLVEISFKPQPNQLEISYTDNGKGFDMSSIAEHKGLGLQNIKSRLQMIEATYTLESALHQGFNMRISVPLG